MESTTRQPAIHGGEPLRRDPLPYARHWLSDQDVARVVEVLRSDRLTGGPVVERFERAFAERVGAAAAVAVSSGTAALHAAMFALGVGPGDEVVVPAMTFAATANAAVFQGATPVFADVEPDTLLLGPAQLAARLSPRTKAVIAVDYAGQPCAYDALREVADRHGAALVADACHALGGRYRGRPVGALAELSTFSFHPVKPITAGEGGMVTALDPRVAERMRAFREHGITTTARERQQRGTWLYEMVDLGYNYRLSDVHAALGLSQLGRLGAWTARRQEIAGRYAAAFGEMRGVVPLVVRPDVSHAYHLYVVRLDRSRLGATREEVFAALRAEGIGVNVHYIPVHLHPYYRRRFGTRPGTCPVAEAAYEEIVSLPIFPRMSDRDVDDVIEAVRRVTEALK